MDVSRLGGLRTDLPLPVDDRPPPSDTVELTLDPNGGPVALPTTFAPAPHPDPASDGLGHDPDVAYGVSHPILQTPPIGDTLAGQAPQPVDRELADLAAAVYDPSKQGAAGWSRLDDAELDAFGIDPASLVVDRTSFKAGIYEKDGNYVLAFAGTEGLFAGKDWWTNLKQGVGGDAEQYNQAIALAKDAKLAFGDHLAITGHSLGGGLASAASAATGNTPTVTFNPAGVNDATYRRMGLDPATARADAESGSVRRYVVGGEVLDYLQEKDHLARVTLEFGPLTTATSLGMPDGVGHRIELADPHPLPWYLNALAPIAAKHSIDLHFLPSVTTAMDADPRFDPPPAAVPAVPALQLPPVDLGRSPTGITVAPFETA